jgi:Zn-dependent protease
VNDPVAAVVYFVVFLLSTTLHEASHAWIALLGGDRTAYHGGQVTLDPMPHIRREPVGMVLVPLVSVMATGWPLGWASAPFDPTWARRFPKRAALMALAGPMANLLLAVLAVALLRAGWAAGVFEPPRSISFGKVVGTTTDGGWTAAATMLGAFFSVNLLLFVFNLLPLPPLDGSGVLPLVIGKAGEDYQQLARSHPLIVLLGLVIAWKVFPILWDPIWLHAINLLYPGVTYGQ